jgi:hypothetical protein
MSNTSDGIYSWSFILLYFPLMKLTMWFVMPTKEVSFSDPSAHTYLQIHVLQLNVTFWAGFLFGPETCVS